MVDSSIEYSIAIGNLQIILARRVLAGAAISPGAPTAGLQRVTITLWIVPCACIRMFKVNAGR